MDRKLKQCSNRIPETGRQVLWSKGSKTSFTQFQIVPRASSSSPENEKQRNEDKTSPITSLFTNNFAQRVETWLKSHGPRHRLHRLTLRSLRPRTVPSSSSAFHPLRSEIKTNKTMTTRSPEGSGTRFRQLLFHSPFEKRMKRSCQIFPLSSSADRCSPFNETQTLILNWPR